MMLPNSGDDPSGDNAFSAEVVELPQHSPQHPLDKESQIERKYVPDAGAAPAQADIQRLCHIWAEVGRAILLRRKRAGEEDTHSC